MPFSVKNRDFSKVEASDIIKVELSTLTNPTTPELSIEYIARGRYTKTAQTAETVFGEVTVFYRHELTFDIIDVATPADTTAGKASTERIIYELTTLPAAFVRITKRNGVQRTLQSGADNVPVMQFRVNYVNEGNVLVARVMGLGFTSVEEVTV